MAVNLFRTFARRLALVLIAIATFVLCSEVSLRVLRGSVPLIKRALYLPGEQPHYDDAPNVTSLIASTAFAPVPFQSWAGFKLNSKGLRSPEYQYTKAPGTCRLVALGDSFTFDSGFVPSDSVWHTALGSDLERSIGRHVEVINLGIPAVGPRFALRMFEVEGARLSPDLVVFAFFVGNDLTDECGARGSWLRRYSATWRLLSRFKMVAHELLGTAAQGRPSGPGGYPVPAREYDADQPLNDDETISRIKDETARLFDEERRHEVFACLDDAVAVVTRLSQQVADVGSMFAVMIVPDQTQVDLDPQRTSHAFGGAPSSTQWLQDELVRRMKQHSIVVSDVLPALRAHARNGPRLYRRGDTHLTIEGNRIAANALLATLVAYTGEMPCLREAVSQ